MTNFLAQVLPPIIGVLSFIMLILALSISIVTTVRQMIPLYIFQASVLALITLLTAVGTDPAAGLFRIEVGIFVIIPVLLVVIIQPLLAQATVPEDIPLRERLRRLKSSEMRAKTRALAMPIWLEHRPQRGSMVLSVAFNLVLIVAAYVVVFRLGMENSSLTNGLAVSIALLLLGLSTMSNKQDLIAQTMGLLVMEHGLFLAIIQVIANPIVTNNFFVGLILYIFITLTILIFLLPELHRISSSIEVQDQQQLKG